MSLRTRLLVPILSSAALAPAAVAQQTPPSVTTLAGTRLEVTPQGAFYRPVTSGTPAGGGSLALQSGHVWTHSDGGALWIGGAVSVGNQGGEVFTEYTANSEAAALLSSNDANPPTPLWVDPSAFGSDWAHVASADATGTHVSLHTINPLTPSGLAVVSKYSTGSNGAPDWTYTFSAPMTCQGDCGSNVGISRDGQTIAAAVTNLATNTVDVAIFSPGSGTPVSFTAVPAGASPYLRGFDLSADGSTLYFSAGTTAHVFDVATQTVVFTSNIGASFDSHAISGDGSVFAYGNFNLIRIFEKVGATYVNTITRTVPGSNFVAHIDISDDSSTVAYGFTYYDQYLTIRVEAIDVATQAVTMTDVVAGTGTNQNVVSGVAISADGERFAVGAWGDAGGLVDEMRYYAKNQNAPLATVDLPGSIFDIALSADGTKMAGASKAVHANAFGNGGRIDLYSSTKGFPTTCFGDGSTATACPCGNVGLPGRGCDNSAGTGGARLGGTGTTAPDTVVLTATDEIATATTIFLQGNANLVNGITFGDGVRCAGGTLKRLYVKAASGGTVAAPAAGDPSVSAQSAALGDPLAPGLTRWYQAYYRDANLGFCPAPAGNSWNVTNAVEITW